MKNNKKETKERKRRRLIAISMEAQQFRSESGQGDLTINQILAEFYYSRTGEAILVFKTFMGWKKAGYNVQKGEKAFLFWGKPIKAQAEPKTEPAGDGATQAQPEQDGDGEDKFSFYPLAYLFSNKQVRPIPDKQLLN